MTGNRLGAETSPYLLQHKDNPVHWRAWGDEALTEAKRLDKPILLSIGYAACHWCHVMAHESFENETIAALMNEHFVNIKVDREERPDLDGIYQAALSMMGEHGGWPLTMFLTPQAEPFWGGTYFPPAPRYGRPSLPQVLEHVAQLYRNDRETIAKNVATLREGFARLAAPQHGIGLSLPLLDEVAGAAFRLIDPIRGGTASAPKFPQPLFFRLLWRGYRRTGRTLFRDAVTLTLDAVCQGGIYDHLGGGFARYATDVDWLVPHFEKMLYDNALLVDLLTEVWLDTATPLYAVRITESIEWMLTEMRIDAGDDGSFALASALDADSDGVEGQYYVWDEMEVDDVLGDDAPLFKSVYHVTPGGNWEGHTILHRHRSSALRSPADEKRLTDARSKLLSVRWQRVPPQRDDKVLADWNGLAIAALTRAGSVLGRPDWIAAAQSIYRFVVRHLQLESGRLLHTWCADQARHPAILDDYANLSRAALILHEATGEIAYREQAEAWVAIADRHYYDEGGGAYFLSADDTTDVIARSKPIADNATPSGNGTMMEVLARLYHLTGRESYRERADEMARVFSGDNLQYLLGMPGLLTNFELLARPVQVVIIGGADDPQTLALHATALAANLPTRMVCRLTPGEALPPGHPAAGKAMVDGVPTAYVCANFACGMPVTTPDALQAQLQAS